MTQGSPPRRVRAGRIADPVHGYIDVTAIENAILAAPVAQRLRNVSQNGLAHYVYPEARSSRFSHSLGVMHLASAMLTASVRNSGEKVRGEIAEAIEAGLRELDGKSDFTEIVSALAAEDRSALTAHHHVAEGQSAAMEIAEQGLRLAALFHDLGHLPFSHDFEYTLREYWDSLPQSKQEQSSIKALFAGERETIHETVGHGLALLLFRVAPTFGPPKGQLLSGGFAVLAAQVAYRILESPPRTSRPEETQGAAAFRWLHTLIAGEVDADRSDYLLRDGRNYGFEFATYDLARLLGSLLIVKEPDGFRLVVDARGSSAVESFVLGRFRSYQFSVRHHKVAQVGAALRHVSRRLLTERADQYAQFLSDVGIAGAAVQDLGASVSDPEALLERFSIYDDVWWLSELRAALREDPNDEWLALVCRRGPGPRSLWKRVERFAQLIVPRTVREWNELLPLLPEEVADWEKTCRELAGEGILVVRHHFLPFGKGNGLSEPPLGIYANAEVRPIAETSALVRSLEQAWLAEIQVHAFVTSDSSIEPSDVLKRLPLRTGGPAT